MKVGDKYYCIKDRVEYFIDVNLPVNSSGEIYEITELYDFYIYLSHDNVYGYCYSIYPEDNEKLFNDYFISLSEYRKLKLEKLNESR